MTKFGTKLRELRLKKGFTFSKASELTGGAISSSFLCRLEHNERNVSIAKIIIIAKLYDFSAIDLMKLLLEDIEA